MNRIISLLLLCLVGWTQLWARELGDVQKWGYAPNDFSRLTTISYLNTAGTYGEGIRVPNKGEWSDCTIEGVSVPVAMTGMKNLRCLVASDAAFRDVLAEVNVPDGQLSKGYNDIAFDEPIPVPDGDFYVGYCYTTTTSGASLVVYDAKADGGLYLYLGSWMDYSPYGMGVSALQVIIGSQSLQEYGVEFRSVEWPNVVCGPTSVRATVRSSSKHAVERFNYSVSIGDEVQRGEIVLPEPLPEGMDRETVIELPLTAPAEAKPFDAVLSIDEVEGAQNVQANGPLTVRLNAVTRQVVRHSVVEEFTGTACGYCPKGWVGMETMKARYGERFVGIAVHQYNQSDPMFCADYARPGFVGAPSCYIDRGQREAIDPYNGSGFYPSSLGDFEAANRLLPDVEVTVNGSLSDDQKSVCVEAGVEFLGQAEGYTLAYVLTADGLTGNGPWMQTNYYHSLAPEAMVNSEMPELADFCQGGEHAQELTHLTFGDVLLASSWNAKGELLSEALPAAAAGTRYTGSYTLVLPTGKQLLAALNYDEIYAVALVIDGDGRVANAARMKVSAPTGVSPVTTETKGAPEMCFGLDGRACGATQRGVILQRSMDGHVRKVMR